METNCYNNYVKIHSDTFIESSPELVLQTVFGYSSFRSGQEEIISSVLSGRDTLAVLPTGGGKSLCYQIPALIFKGITVVVSPLISLMQDQVSSLRASGINSVFLNSSLERDGYIAAVDGIKSGNVKIVYVSPEGLATGRIRELLCENVTVSCITIDEAHCVSEWGHDFRPDYLDIRSVRKILPGAVMLALTATATEQVRGDIVNNLGMKNPFIFVSSFNRSNIYLEVRQKKNPEAQVIEYLGKHKNESGIIYCFSRRQVDELTESLEKKGFPVRSYHAGLTDERRAKNQELFIKDEIKIMVATVAFGMGINKPNVRFVINYDLPKSIEEYYQETGRAGRDGKQAYSLLLYSSGDIHKIRYFFEEAADSKKSEKLLQGMLNFAASGKCRRRTLLEYFGEPYIQKNNQDEFCCDICSSGEKPENDVTVPVQKLLCCIIRTGERFGTSYIVDVLLGSRQKRIIENRHNFLSTWGIGNELSRDEWFELVNLLIVHNYLRKSGEYNILRITAEGKSVLATRETIRMPFVFSGSKNTAVRIPKTYRPKYIVHKKNRGESSIAEKTPLYRKKH